VIDQQVVPGEVLAGKYRVERLLGQGGMGVVVLATHLQLARRVAVKFLISDALSAEGAIDRFLREARAAVQFRGEHVARVIDVGTFASGAPFIVMEYLEGLDLGKLLDTRGPLPIPEAVDYVLQVCEALSEAHTTLGIVHRDLKPSNLFLTQRPDGSPLIKVLDFGISKMQHTPDSSFGAITSATAVMGSPLYMSPEQVTSSRDVDHRTDIWSLGIILHELLVGSPPFRGDSAPAVLVAISVGLPPPLTSERPDAPSELEGVVRRCLNKDRDLRFRDVSELAQALEPFASPAGRGTSARIAKTFGLEAARPVAAVTRSLREIRQAEADDDPDLSEPTVTMNAWQSSGVAISRPSLSTAAKFPLLWIVIGAASGFVLLVGTVITLVVRSSAPEPVALGSATPPVVAAPPIPAPRPEPTVAVVPQPSEPIADYPAPAAMPTVPLSALEVEPPEPRYDRPSPPPRRPRRASNPPPRPAPPAPKPAGPNGNGWREVFDDMD
jgi:serine/threonine protein kinase